MASLSSVFLECIVPLLAQDVPAPASPQPQLAPPWVVVDSPLTDRHDSVEELQLVALSDGTYFGSYQLTGSHFHNRGTHVVRSRDRGATWQRVALLEHCHHVSLIEHDDVVWLLGVEGTHTASAGPLVVMCLRGTPETWTGGASLLRSSAHFSAAQDTVLHAGRVWRSFSHDLSATVGDTRNQSFVGSAALGSNLQDPASWRWSGEVASDGWGMDVLVTTDTGDLALAVFEPGKRTLGLLADVTNKGLMLATRTELPAWNLPFGWRSSLVHDPLGGRFHLLVVESSRDTELLDRAPRNALTLYSSARLLAWNRRQLLHDREERPLQFGPAAALVEGDDLAALISFEQPPAAQLDEPRIPLTIAFLRVPKFRDRTIGDLPLWGPPFPR